MADKWTSVALWILRLLAAVILLQTLYFKFSAAEESVYIFSTIGMEPWGRIGSGVLELIASILILYPRTTAIGALLGIGLMSGALFFHLIGKLGIVVKDDGGQLFIYALIVFISCVILLIARRKDLVYIIHKVLNKR